MNASNPENYAGNDKTNILQLQKCAENRHGRLLSAEYINENTKYLWECCDGHQW